MERRLLTERLYAMTAAALELTEDLAAEPPGALNEVEEQDLRDLTLMLQRATHLAALMTGRRSVEERPGHLERVTRRHLDGAREAAARLAATSPAPSWAAETAKRLDDAAALVGSARSRSDVAPECCGRLD